mgnify:CR=1 FL=1
MFLKSLHGWVQISGPGSIGKRFYEADSEDDVTEYPDPEIFEQLDRDQYAF